MRIILSVLGLSLVLGTFEVWAADPFNKEEKEFERSSDRDAEGEGGCPSCS